MHDQSLQSCPALCDPVGYRPPVSSIHGILQARILEWVAVLSSKGSPLPRDQTHVSQQNSSLLCLLHCRQILYPLSHPGSPLKAIIFLLLLLCHFLQVSICIDFTVLSLETESESRSVMSDSATPWTVVHGILQARILEWVAFPFSRESSQPRDGAQVSRIAGRLFTG